MARRLISVGLLFLASCQSAILEEEIRPQCGRSTITVDGLEFCFQLDASPKESRIVVPDSMSVLKTQYHFESQTLIVSVLVDKLESRKNDEGYLQLFHDLQAMFLPGIYTLDEDQLVNRGSFAVEYLEGQEYYSTLFGDQAESFVKVIGSNLDFYGRESSVESNLWIHLVINCKVYSNSGDFKNISGLVYLRI